MDDSFGTFSIFRRLPTQLTGFLLSFVLTLKNPPRPIYDRSQPSDPLGRANMGGHYLVSIKHSHAIDRLDQLNRPVTNQAC